MVPAGHAHQLLSADQQHLQGLVPDGVIAAVDALLYRAIERGASDIHIQPHEHVLVVRERIDGHLYDAQHIDNDLAPQLISRIKIMASMDIAQRRLPQDGRMQVVFHPAVGAERVIDVRVATFPIFFGEKLVLRLLDQETRLLSLAGLGLSQTLLPRVEHLIARPHGLFLVTGPTGCGKTTMLYALLTCLNARDKNIVTIEDPIEYLLPGVAQSQVNTTAGFTFASGLRALLRQDPDIIMLGEIRDRETARIAMEAALTGHLVLSTLHTNDAPSAVTRLLEMGVEPFLISATLVGVLAQRLVRLLCASCKHAQGVRAAGCTACNNIGFKGQTGIFQLLSVDQALQSFIAAGDVAALQAHLAQMGLATLLQDGLEKVGLGLTTEAEVRAVAQ